MIKFLVHLYHHIRAVVAMFRIPVKIEARLGIKNNPRIWQRSYVYGYYGIPDKMMIEEVQKERDWFSGKEEA